MQQQELDMLRSQVEELMAWKQKRESQQIAFPLDKISRDILDRDSSSASGLSAVYPIGSIYFNKVNSANPATYLGFGTWVALERQVLAGYKAGDPDFGAIGSVGVASVTLTIGQIPAHTHTGKYQNLGGGANFGFVAGGYVETADTGSAGGGGSHTNVQPTLVGYMWERTA